MKEGNMDREVYRQKEWVDIWMAPAGEVQKQTFKK